MGPAGARIEDDGATASPEPHRFDAVIFDLDGVLVDSEIWWDEVRQAFAAAHGRAWTLEDRAAVMGANSRQWAATMRERLGLDLSAGAIERAIVDGVVERYRTDPTPIIAGAIETVRRVAAERPVAVASSAHGAVIDAALSATGLADAFGVVVSSDEVALGKPAPDVYLEAARRLEVAPERCLVVEDSLNGVLAGVAAGMTVVLVPNRSIPPSAGAAERAHQVLAEIASLDPDAIPVADTVPAPGPVPESVPVPTAAVPGAGPAPLQEPAPVPAGASEPVLAVAPPRPMARATPSPSPPGQTAAWRLFLRYWISRLVVRALAGAYFRIRIEDRDRIPPGPAIYCFNHLNWTDPFVLMAALPMRPRLFFFGPKEEDMRTGGRNLLMLWSGSAVPYKPGKNDLLVATRRVDAVLRSGGVLAIAGEGRIGARESALLPLNEGTAYFAIRSGVPIVPIAINGTSWLRFGRAIRVRIGVPIPTAGRPTREAIADVTRRTTESLEALLADAPDLPVPGPFGRWFTEVFNDWPEGSREAAEAVAHGDPPAGPDANDG